MGKIIDVKVPELAESIVEGTIEEWKIQEGQSVQEGDTLVSLETDKVTLDIPSPVSGVITSLLATDGQDVQVGDVIVKIEEGAVGSVVSKEKSPQPSQNTQTQQVSSVQSVASSDSSMPSNANTSVHTPSPSAVRMANAQGINIQNVSAGGPKGNVLKEDVQNYVQQNPKNNISSMEDTTRVKMSRIRQAIGRNLMQANQNTVMLTTFNEVNMASLMKLRSTYKDAFEKKNGVKLGFMSFFVKATIEALTDFPVVGSFIDGTDLVYHNHINIAVAIGSERGLVVPVLKHAEQMSFEQIEKQIVDFGKRAKAGKLSMQEMEGGSFTITNGGVFGSLFSTPIINYPQAAILGMHGIQKRPIVNPKGDIVVGDMMYLALTYDHRIIDGREAVLFLRRIKDCIEDPSRLLLQV